MKLRKFNSIYGDKVREKMELICTEEEYEVLREFLNAEGVCLSSSVIGCGSATVYVRNPYKQAVESRDRDGSVKKWATELFDRWQK